MFFELTDSLSLEILRGMENQKQRQALDAKNCRLVPWKECLVDEENFYSLPVWNSADGYNVLESFVSKNKGIKPYSQLKQILAEGRGVFRQFKDVLKKYPQTERNFNLYKAKIMKVRLFDWYNMLRDSWGLESLEIDFEDEFDDLTLEDFIFRQYNANLDSSGLVCKISSFSDELKKMFPGDAGLCMSVFFGFENENTIQENLKNSCTGGFVCHTPENEFAGCLLYSSKFSKSQKSVFITTIFVEQNYRGLGIAGKLLDLSLKHLRKSGIQVVIALNSVVPKIMESLLIRSGFTGSDFAFFAELN